MSDDRTLSQQSDLAAAVELAAAREHWGPFLLRERVGHGAFGEVYRAWDPALEREVALKLLVPRAVTSDADYQQMLREARALASVRHPNVVPVYGIDRHDDRVGFWTDFVHGNTLFSLVRTNGPFGYREAALIGIDVARALSAVHRAGLLHRDIKAENVMRESGGRILLMDFGLSPLPHHQSLAGTPAYMAPELFRGLEASAVSDIYALGVLLFYLVAGEYPSPVKTVSAETADEIVRTRRSLLDLRPDLPDKFIRAIECCLCLDPKSRFQSAGQLATALAESLGTGSLADPSLPPSAPKGASLGRRLVGAAAAVALAVGIWSYLHHPRGAAGSLPISTSSNEEYLKAEDLLQHSYKKGNLDQAIGILRGILARDSSFALAEAGLGRAYFLKERYSGDKALLAEARNASQKALELDRTLAPPYVTLARMDVDAGHSALAMQEVHQALAADPNSAEAFGAESEVFDLQGRSAEAIAAAQKASDLAPDEWRWPNLLGAYQFDAGHYEESARRFQRAADLAPDNPLTHTNLARAQIQLNQFAAAEANLRQSISLEPTGDTYSALGALLTTEGKYDEAIRIQQLALKLEPDNYEHWGDLAADYFYVHHGADSQGAAAYARAIKLAERVRTLRPKDPDLLIDLAGYYAAVNQPQRALPLIRQVLAVANDNPLVIFNAGEAYEMLGQREKAIDLIARAQALGYGTQELQNSPRLAALRADPAFQIALRSKVEQKAADSLDNGSAAK